MPSSTESNSVNALPVIIVGAGFSGTLLAINLVRRGQSAVLVERDPSQLAKGLAFGSARPEHLLNVRALNMSAFPGDPQHFLRWMGVSSPDRSHRFVPRLAYGHYLRSLLLDAMSKSGSLLHVREGNAEDIVGQPGEEVVLLSSGERLRGRAVVLAQGNLLPRLPEALAGLGPGRVFANPWDAAALDGLPDDAPVLLIGSGLTAIDVALSLNRNGHTGVIHVLSRRGLRPRSHDDAIVPLRPIACARRKPVLRWLRACAAVRARSAGVLRSTSCGPTRGLCGKGTRHHSKRGSCGTCALGGTSIATASRLRWMPGSRNSSKVGDFVFLPESFSARSRRTAGSRCSGAHAARSAPIGSRWPGRWSAPVPKAMSPIRPKGYCGGWWSAEWPEPTSTGWASTSMRSTAFATWRGCRTARSLR